MSIPESIEPQEGSYSIFSVVNEITLPPDQDRFYVMASETGTRYMVRADYYRHYQLRTGMQLRCRVDKVNCSGKVYLEPDHPFCKPGDVLPCEVVSSVFITNSLGREERLLLLNDPWGNPCHVRIGHRSSQPMARVVNVRVERIKKGTLLLSLPNENYFGNNQPPDASRPFRIRDVITLAPKQEFYVLEQEGSIHYLRTKYFNEYGLTGGATLQLRVLGGHALYQHYLEPDHPYYQVGQRYTFELLGTERIAIRQNQPHYLLQLGDRLGHRYSLEMEGAEPDRNMRVSAKVTAIRMSKCRLADISFEQSDDGRNGSDHRL